MTNKISKTDEGSPVLEVKLAVKTPMIKLNTMLVRMEYIHQVLLGILPSKEKRICFIVSRAAAC